VEKSEVSWSDIKTAINRQYRDRSRRKAHCVLETSPDIHS